MISLVIYSPSQSRFIRVLDITLMQRFHFYRINKLALVTYLHRRVRWSLGHRVRVLVAGLRLVIVEIRHSTSRGIHYRISALIRVNDLILQMRTNRSNGLLSLNSFDYRLIYFAELLLLLS
jgi:hypothetical protein